jgi:hypothetical protein
VSSFARGAVDLRPKRSATWRDVPVRPGRGHAFGAARGRTMLCGGTGELGVNPLGDPPGNPFGDPLRPSGRRPEACDLRRTSSSGAPG